MKLIIMTVVLMAGVVVVTAQTQTCTTNCTDFPKGYHQCVTRCR